MDDSSGRYLKNENSANERDVYHHESNNKFCIWWHKQWRHWWLGDCDNIGQNLGYAYLGPDKSCPNEGKSGDWRRGGSDIGTQGYLWHSGKMFQ